MLLIIKELQEKWRRERDLNSRCGDRTTVFETAAFDHSAISPDCRKTNISPQPRNTFLEIWIILNILNP